MAAISETGHNWFMQRMEVNATPEQQQLVQDDLEQMRELYEDYHDKLGQLRQIAEEYEATRQNIRFKLRSQQKAARREK